MANREPISKKTRFEVFKRDSFACQYCGSTPPSVVLHVDHIHPVSKGGKNSMANLITSCSSCNLGKGAITLDTVEIGISEKAALIKEREAQIKGYHKQIEATRRRVERESWDVAAALVGEERVDSFGKTRLASIRNFLGKIDYYEVLGAAEITFSKFRSIETITNNQFKYFCAICWSKIKEGHGHA